MNTILMKFFWDAWTSATGIYLTAQPRADKKKICTNIVKLTPNRTFALQQLSHLHIPELARSRYMDKWLRVHTTPTEELWNN